MDVIMSASARCNISPDQPPILRRGNIRLVTTLMEDFAITSSTATYIEVLISFVRMLQWISTNHGRCYLMTAMFRGAFLAGCAWPPWSLL